MNQQQEPVYEHGIRAIIGQFSQQLLQVFFVGLTIGLQRNVIPALAEQEFGVPANSFTLLSADLFAIEPETIRDVRVLRTVIGGRDMFIAE